jgi:serine/threonine protein kinase
VLQEQALSNPFANPQCQKLTDRYDGFEKLGEGSCGVVYKVRPKADNKEVAIKVMRMQDEEQLQIAENEYTLLKRVCHPKIIRAIDFFTYSMGAVLVLEFFEGRKLEKVVREAPRRRLREAVARGLFVQLIDALAHLHSQGVVHRDVKSDNILVSHDISELRLVDFNAATFDAGGALTMTGTVDYMPPEVLQGDSPSEAGDVWAAGLCLHLMLSGRLPSQRRSLRIRPETDEASPAPPPLRLEGSKWSDVSEPCQEMVKQCLEANCSLRPPASELLGNPWLAKALCD